MLWAVQLQELDAQHRFVSPALLRRRSESVILQRPCHRRLAGLNSQVRQDGHAMSQRTCMQYGNVYQECMRFWNF